MTDVVDAAIRSRMMSGIRGKDTRPEMRVRRFLHGQGFRYRLNARRLPGRPDIVLPKFGVCIFVHGCFWHRHRGCKLTATPSTRPAFWQKKFSENVARDKRARKQLIEDGWRVIEIWECGLREHGEAGIVWLPKSIRAKRPSLIVWPQKDKR